MGQSLLIDINSGWYKHKTEVNDGLKTRNDTQVKGSLYALNALLPQKYRVIIDDDLYRQRIKGDLVALCNNCTSTIEDETKKGEVIEVQTQTDYNKLEILHLLLESLERVAYNKEYDDFWICSKCNEMNRLSETKFRQVILQKPFYLQVVPEPPKRHIGIQDRITYHAKFESWARNFLGELNAQAQKFRQEYKPTGDEADLGDDSFAMEDEDL